MVNTPSSENAGTIRIPVRVVRGRVAYLHGSRLPPLRTGTVGELVVPADAVLDSEWRDTLRMERRETILAAGTEILMAVRIGGVPPHLRARLYRFDDDTRQTAFDLDGVPESHYESREWRDFAFVPIVLDEPLDLLTRGTRKAALRGGGCTIPALGQEAISLNHAYTLISQIFEPERKSHTGNVFHRARYRDGARWRLLEELRSEKEAGYEKTLAARGAVAKRPRPRRTLVLTQPEG